MDQNRLKQVIADLRGSREVISFITVELEDLAGVLEEAIGDLREMLADQDS